MKHTPVILKNVVYGNDISFYRYEAAGAVEKGWNWSRTLDDKAFVELWQSSKDLNHFRESFAHNHKADYSPQESAAVTRKKKIEKRYGVVLKKLRNSREVAKQEYAESIKDLADSLTISSVTDSPCPSCEMRNEV
jgi:hypothetical protein